MSIFLISLSGLSLNKQDDCSLVNLENHFKLNIPNLRKFGLFKYVDENDNFFLPIASYGTINTQKNSVIKQISQMLDSDLNENFDTFSSEIPSSIVEKIRQIFRCKPLYCKRGDFQSAVKECGASAKNYCYPIVYTKENESVLKIAVHEKCFKEKDFFELIDILFKEITDYNIHTIEGKIFAGENDFYKTQHNRILKKISCNSKLLKTLKSRKIKLISVGKVQDYIDEKCFNENYASKTDILSLKTLEKLALRKENLFAFAYLTDYEKIYSAHGDLLGARMCLETIDEVIGNIVKHLKNDDLLIFTSTYSGHNNSVVPLLVFQPNNQQNSSDLGEFEDFNIINSLIEQH